MPKIYQCVMLVDDDEISNYISERIIKNLGIAKFLHISANGKQALNFIKEECLGQNSSAECPEFILLDINMPVMDGFQFLEEFYKLGFKGMDEVKIVILTSSNSPKDVAFADKYNISGYINKPLSKEKLEDVLAKIG